MSFLLKGKWSNLRVGAFPYKTFVVYPRGSWEVNCEVVRVCKELINFIDLLVHLICFIDYTIVVVEVTRQTHSVRSFFRLIIIEL